VANKLDMGRTLRERLSDNFVNSESYFKEMPGVIIGKMPKGPKENQLDNSIIDFSVVGGNSVLQDITKYKKKIKLRGFNEHGKMSTMGKKSIKPSHLDTPVTGSILNTNSSLLQTTGGKGMTTSQQLLQQQKQTFIEFIEDKRINQIFERYRYLSQENTKKKSPKCKESNLYNSLQTNPSNYGTQKESNLGLLTINNSSKNVGDINPTNHSHSLFKSPSEKSLFSDMPKEFKKKMSFQEKTLELHSDNEFKKK